MDLSHIPSIIGCEFFDSKDSQDDDVFHNLKSVAMKMCVRVLSSQATSLLHDCITFVLFDRVCLCRRKRDPKVDEEFKEQSMSLIQRPKCVVGKS